MDKHKIESIAPEILIKNYQTKSVSELLHITPKWAYGINSKHILDITLRPNNNEFSFFIIEISSIIPLIDLYEGRLNPLFTGESLNDNRVARILWRWENNLFIDPPSISIENSSKTKISFFDGRHRFKASYHLKQKKIPIAIWNEDIVKIKPLIQLDPI